MKEEWKDVVGYEGKYKVSNLGRVISLARKNRTKDRILPGILSNDGYLMVKLCSAPNPVNKIGIHRIVGIAFLSESRTKEKVFINHKNGIKTDNRVENLEWCTPRENNLHAFRTGLSKYVVPKRGSQHGNAVLKECDVLAIRKLIADNMTDIKIAQKFGVVPSCIHKIRSGKNWGHLK